MTFAALVVEFIVRNWKWLVGAGVIIGLFTAGYINGRSAMQRKIAVIKSEMALAEQQRDGAFGALKDAKETIDKLRQAIQDQNAMIQEIAESASCREAELQQMYREAEATRRRRWQEKFADMLDEQERLRARMEQLTPYESCDLAVRRIGGTG